MIRVGPAASIWDLILSCAAPQARNDHHHRHAHAHAQQRQHSPAACFCVSARKAIRKLMPIAMRPACHLTCRQKSRAGRFHHARLAAQDEAYPHHAFGIGDGLALAETRRRRSDRSSWLHTRSWRRGARSRSPSAKPRSAGRDAPEASEKKDLQPARNKHGLKMIASTGLEHAAMVRIVIHAVMRGGGQR